MSNESMANYITDIPSGIAELLAVNKQLEQELQKTRVQLNEHRTALKNLLFDETDNSHMEAENLLEKYKEQFKDKQGEG